MTAQSDGWTAASHYERFMGRWSRALAPRFLAWLQPPANSHWLEVGCGTGALTAAICRHTQPASVTACDPASPFIAYARSQLADPRVTFVEAAVGALPARPGAYGSVASLLALNFFPDPAAALNEMRALALPGAVISACVWDYAGRMDFLRYFWDAASALDPQARELDEGPRFPICRPQALTRLFEHAGLHDIRCEPLDMPSTFAGFDDYWNPFLGATGPGPAYVASLDEDGRARLAQQLRQTLPQQPDGTINLIARAWAINGTAP